MFPFGPPLISLFQEKYILVEYKHIARFIPPGIYVLPSFDSLNCTFLVLSAGADSVLGWPGVLFVRSGPYKGAVVNFRVNLPAAYPTEAPSIELLDRPFHPHVNPVTGILDCGELVRNWQPHKSFVYGTNSVCAFSVCVRIQCLQKQPRIAESPEEGLLSDRGMALSCFLSSLPPRLPLRRSVTTSRQRDCSRGASRSSCSKRTMLHIARTAPHLRFLRHLCRLRWRRSYRTSYIRYPFCVRRL